MEDPRVQGPVAIEKDHSESIHFQDDRRNFYTNTVILYTLCYKVPGPVKRLDC